jgi:outer membrane receptor protein involved in Fe transport
VALFAADRWQPSERLTVDFGVRGDWFESIHRAGVAPRVSVAWSPTAGAHTKLTAGYAIVHEPPNLALLSRPLDQQAVTTPYDAAGVPETPLVSVFRMGGNLAMPRYANWSAGVERDFGGSLSARAEWLRKRGRDGFVYASATPSAAMDPGVLGYKAGGIYVLSNQRRDAYDEAAITVRQSFGDQYEWMASYVRSRAVSNAVLDVSIDQPQQVTANSGPMPWDAPNRLLSWAYLPFPFLDRKKWALSGMADWRSGFPFSLVTSDGVISGPVDSRRYPATFDLNLYVERRFTLRGYRLALRGGVNNATDHRNPTVVNDTIGSPGFLQFYGDEGRHFEVRIRMFGKPKI